jgi:hypothetical protein
MTHEARVEHKTGLRRAYLAVAGIFCLIVLGEIWYGLGHTWFTGFNDYDHCMGVARRWLADGSYFLPVQPDGRRTVQAVVIQTGASPNLGTALGWLFSRL